LHGKPPFLRDPVFRRPDGGLDPVAGADLAENADNVGLDRMGV
jgi:hypothetical protein